MSAEEALARAREAALRLLDAQPRTRRNLARRLSDRGYPEEAIEGALDRLVAVGLVDDRAYAEGFIRRRLRLKPRGWLLLKRELLDRGVPEEVTASALAEFAARIDESDLARDVLRRRTYRLRTLSPDVARRRAIASLRRLGFCSSAIIAAVDSWQPE
jgi:regulatory protein